MASNSPKTLEDFPKFLVTSLRRSLTADGYTSFELEGYLDQHIKAEGPQWFWLLFGKRGSLCTSLQSLDQQTRAAVLTFQQSEQPDIVGHRLAYLSPYWQAYHVWMVLDPEWGWEKKQFLGMDAIAEDFQAKDISIIDGREVKVWTKLSKASVPPVQITDLTITPESGKRIIPSGWDHEHCELCNSHIDIGMLGYCDSEDHWMCENCHARYVCRHDLAFVDEL